MRPEVLNVGSGSLADSILIVLAAALVMLMQGGFCFLESGLSRAKNSINVAIKNVIDFCLSGVTFWLVGFAIMFGASWQGWFGTSGFLIDESVGSWTLAFFLFQLVFCGTATTIVSGAVAERMRFSAYLVVSVVVAAVFYPVFGHWVWNGGGVTGSGGWLNSLGFIDFAGSTVVHSLGGWIALAAVLVIGPRAGRFGPGGGEIPGHNLPMATFGVLTLWFGWFGFNAGSTLAVSESIPLILINTNLAAASGGLISLAVSWAIERRPVVPHTLNGIVAGLVAITAGCHVVSPAWAVVIGGIGGAVCTAGTYALSRLEIDDAIGAFPAHSLGGIWGTLAVALFAHAEAFGEGVSRWEQLAIQMQGILACFAWAFGGGYIVLRCIDVFFPLRVSPEAEREGLNIAEHGASTELIDLLQRMDEHRASGEFSRPVVVEPHTEVGQIALQYNAVLSRVNNEISSRQAAEEKYRSIFENAIEGIFQTSIDGRYLSANPALLRMYGDESLEALSDRIADIRRQLYVEPKRRDEFVTALLADGRVTDFESEVYRADGQRIWISENARIHRNADGAIQYFEGSVQDISDRKRHAAMLHEVRAAEAKNRAKSEFLAGVSHEIRTPLNGVIGMIGLLRDTKLDATQSHYCDIANSSANALLSLINDILDLSKIEAGKLELEMIEFDLRVMVEETVATFLLRAAARGIELTLSVAPSLPNYAVGDPERIRQILSNLLANAIKFTENGSVDVRVELDVRAEIADDGRAQSVRFAVADSGIGIDEEGCRRLFQAFSQVDSSMSRRFGGTGLGLSISRQLTDMMDGSIGVESEPNVGSTFWFTLPLTLRAGGSMTDAAERQRVRQLRVLAVDDNLTNLMILREQLASWQLEIETASTAADAMEILRNTNADRIYDIIFIDRILGDADGFDVADYAASHRRARRVVMLTSFDDAEGIEKAGRAGIMYLRKPVRQSQLWDCLRQHGSVGRGACSSVLIVDDNEINRLVAAKLVSDAGYDCRTVDNGTAALREIELRRFAAVLMDCQMPGMDGFETTRRIRAMESRDGGLCPGGTRLPIIALTANAIRGDRARCLESGMDDYLTKPIDREQLRSILQKHAAATFDSDRVRTALHPTAGNIASAPSAMPSVAGDETQPAIDLAELSMRCGGDASFVDDVLRLFEKEAPAHWNALTAAFASRRFDEAARRAHCLKGIAANVGAKPLQESLMSLEQSIQQSTTEQVTAAEAGGCDEQLALIERRVEEALMLTKSFLEI